MTENQLRQNVANIINAWVGATKGSAKHLEILEIYNGHEPLARGYKMQVKDAYCAATVSAAYIKAGIAEYTGTECGVEKFTVVAKNKGIWVENDAHTPKIGDACVYDWDDSDFNPRAPCGARRSWAFRAGGGFPGNDAGPDRGCMTGGCSCPGCRCSRGAIPDRWF